MRLAGELTKWHQWLEEPYKQFEQLGVNHRQIEALAYAARLGKITRAEYIEITKAAPVTASRDLAHLVDLGVLRAQGRTRGRVYILEPPGTSDKTRSTQGAQQPRLFDTGG